MKRVLSLLIFVLVTIFTSVNVYAQTPGVQVIESQTQVVPAGTLPIPDINAYTDSVERCGTLQNPGRVLSINREECKNNIIINCLTPYYIAGSNYLYKSPEVLDCVSGVIADIRNREDQQSRTPAREPFSNLSATLEEDKATFNFTYSGRSLEPTEVFYIIAGEDQNKLSGSSGGKTSPIIITGLILNSLIKSPEEGGGKYECGKKIYWSVAISPSGGIRSALQGPVTVCGSEVPSTPTSTATPTPLSCTLSAKLNRIYPSASLIDFTITGNSDFTPGVLIQNILNSLPNGGKYGPTLVEGRSLTILTPNRFYHYYRI